MYSLNEIGLIPAVISNISHRSEIEPCRIEVITDGIVTQPIDKLPIDNTIADNKHLWDSKTIQDKIN